MAAILQRHRSALTRFTRPKVRSALLLGSATLAFGLVGCGASAPTAQQDIAIVGNYNVVGDILSSTGDSGEAAGDTLQRHWAITRYCTSQACSLVLTRDLAALSGVPPISAVLRPTSGGWTASFKETQACPGLGVMTTEYSTWKVWKTANGLEAVEQGRSPKVSAPNGYYCATGHDVIHWYATPMTTTDGAKEA